MISEEIGDLQQPGFMEVTLRCRGLHIYSTYLCFFGVVFCNSVTYAGALGVAVYGMNC
jgi:hypothetical protein